MDKKIVIDHIMGIKNKYRIGIIESIVMYCEESGIDIEDFSEEIKKEQEFINIIKLEAIEDRYLRKSDGWVQKSSLKSFFT